MSENLKSGIYSLDLSRKNIENDDLKKLDNIREINLPGNRIGAKGARILSRIKELEVIDLSFNWLKDSRATFLFLNPT